MHVFMCLKSNIIHAQVRLRIIIIIKKKLIIWIYMIFLNRMKIAADGYLS